MLELAEVLGLVSMLRVEDQLALAVVGEECVAEAFLVFEALCCEHQESVDQTVSSHLLHVSRR